MNGSEFSWSEFLHMGGYATFVWSSYGLALVMVVVNIVSPLIERKHLGNISDSSLMISEALIVGLLIIQYLLDKY